MKFYNFLVVIVLHKLLFYRFDLAKQSKKTLSFIKAKPPQTRKKEWVKSHNKKIFLASEFPTKIDFFRNTETQLSRDEYLSSEQKSASNRLTNPPKLALISSEAKMLDLFTYRLGNLNGLQKELVKAASFDSNHAVTISSYFAISTEQKQKLRRVIREKINTHAQVEFKIEEDFNRGIALRGRGYKIFSNLDCCITELDKKVENQAAKEKARLKQLIRT